MSATTPTRWTSSARPTGTANRRPPASLHIVHRIDKDTSGLALFARRGRRSATQPLLAGTTSSGATSAWSTADDRSGRSSFRRRFVATGCWTRRGSAAMRAGARLARARQAGGHHVKVLPEYLGGHATGARSRIETGARRTRSASTWPKRHPIIGETVHIRDFCPPRQRPLRLAAAALARRAAGLWSTRAPGMHLPPARPAAGLERASLPTSAAPPTEPGPGRCSKSPTRRNRRRKKSSL